MTKLIIELCSTTWFLALVAMTAGFFGADFLATCAQISVCIVGGFTVLLALVGLIAWIAQRVAAGLRAMVQA